MKIVPCTWPRCLDTGMACTGICQRRFQGEVQVALAQTDEAWGARLLREALLRDEVRRLGT